MRQHPTAWFTDAFLLPERLRMAPGTVVHCRSIPAWVQRWEQAWYSKFGRLLEGLGLPSRVSALADDYLGKSQGIGSIWQLGGSGLPSRVLVALADECLGKSQETGSFLLSNHCLPRGAGAWLRQHLTAWFMLVDYRNVYGWLQRRWSTAVGSQRVAPWAHARSRHAIPSLGWPAKLPSRNGS